MQARRVAVREGAGELERADVGRESRSNDVCVDWQQTFVSPGAARVAGDGICLGQNWASGRVGN